MRYSCASSMGDRVERTVYYYGLYPSVSGYEALGIGRAFEHR